jgi:predicted dehydrogenase
MKDTSGMTRRDFVRAGVAAGTAAALATPAATAQESLKPVRIGVVGVGRRGTFLVQTLLDLPGVEINAVCDLVPESAANAQSLVEAKTGKRSEVYTKGERDFENLVRRDDLDAVICATTWQWHTPVMVAAMRAGKYGGTEVPAALTLDECWDLVRTSEETGKPCMMLENVCYFQNVLTILRMVREGVFGGLLHFEGGYQHDCRFITVTDDGRLTWRGELMATDNGNQYPTHPIGPIAQWMNINRGDRFTYLASMSTPAKGMAHYAARKFGPEHALAKRSYAQGDVNTTLLQTENGLTVTLYFDMTTHRPYDLIFRVQGVKGLYLGTLDKVCIEDVTAGDAWEPFAPFLEKYAHPLWTELAAEAQRTGGHGGGDYITLYEFVKAVRNQTPPPQDVYDAATWSAVVPLSKASVAQQGQRVEFPDFTRGKWKTSPPLSIYGA